MRIYWMSSQPPRPMLIPIDQIHRARAGDQEAVDARFCAHGKRSRAMLSVGHLRFRGRRDVLQWSSDEPHSFKFRVVDPPGAALMVAWSAL